MILSFSAVRLRRHYQNFLILLYYQNSRNSRFKQAIIHTYNILLLVKYFYSRTKCAFVLDENSQESVPGGDGELNTWSKRFLKSKINVFLSEFSGAFIKDVKYKWS